MEKDRPNKHADQVRVFMQDNYREGPPKILGLSLKKPSYFKTESRVTVDNTYFLQLIPFLTQKYHINSGESPSSPTIIYANAHIHLAPPPQPLGGF